jgi:hypothetical protein
MKWIINNIAREEIKIYLNTTKTFYLYLALWFPKIVEKLFPDKTLMIAKLSVEGGDTSIIKYTYNSLFNETDNQ